ncbi:uncharacterized protein MONBRDRAFT_8521 [Monosiga brevicollis MX1]|uniref:PH domain-containing protein n=1 Tax=Monosiga brevicollis TaxID=81824 RepID=A9V0A2_MONBE|nr:uncharacterized protein MONBRDRAFT_8521 [Monosiga brevicollis MX1]EDQ88974.1 predicted protein [Monosiga brevicollis MX1]|eukprot:XP_001746079.1 hypothetical protein [Monosiga brevicollis MX1]
MGNMAGRFKADQPPRGQPIFFGSVVKRGWVKKSWQVRFMEAYPSGLYYYRTDSAELPEDALGAPIAPAGFIPVSEIVCVIKPKNMERIPNINWPMKKHDQAQLTNCRWGVETSIRKFYFVSPTVEACNEWIEIVSTLLGQQRADPTSAGLARNVESDNDDDEGNDTDDELVDMSSGHHQPPTQASHS